MNSYEMKQEARRERLENAAARARQESESHMRASHAATEGIPFGQPILVGHHSEGRHRRAIEKSWNQLGKAVEAEERAKDLARRAAAVGSGGISSDDPDAVAKLREKLANEIESRDAMKNANKAYREARKLGAERPAPAELVAQLAEKYKIPEAIARVAIDWVADYAYQRAPFEGYSFQNIGANIRRIEARIADLERRAKVAEVIAAEVEAAKESGAPLPNEKVIGAVRIVQNVEANRLQVFFPGKPAYDVRAKLKSYGFRWAPSEGAWQRHLSNAATYAAESIANSLVSAGGAQ